MADAREGGAVHARAVDAHRARDLRRAPGQGFAAPSPTRYSSLPWARNSADFSSMPACAAAQAGMEEKSAEFRAQGSELYRVGDGAAKP